MDTSSPRKRTRIDPSVSTTLKALELENSAPPLPPPRSLLESLPVELLSEVLSYMPTPNDLLNITRASRYLCNTMLNKGNAHIWVNARKKCVAGEVPEPPAGWSEPAHAALMFDGGLCEQCGHYTKRMLVSYAVEARLCGNSICRRQFFNHKLILPRSHGNTSKALALETRRKLAYVEDLKAFGQRSYIMHSNTFRYYRKSNYQDVVNQHNSAVRAGDPSTPAEIDQDPEVMATARRQEHYAKLGAYRAHYEQQYQTVKSRNVQLIQRFSESKKWDVGQVMNTPTIKAMLTTANRCLTRIRQSDLEHIEEPLKTEINVTALKRDNAKTEHARQQRRADIDKYYQILKSDNKAIHILPPLADFRRLPFIAHLQDKDAKTVLNDLKSDGVLPNSMLQSDLNAWIKKQHAGFQQLLGYEKWRDPNPDILSPADRINARFHCTLCGHVPMKLEEAGSFDFVSACNHQCANLGKRELKTHVFSAANFVADLKGKAVIENAARLVGVELNIAGAAEKLNALGVRFLCKSCPGRIVMPFSRLSGHAQRHENMEIELLSPEAAAVILSDAPYERGAKLKYFYKQVGPEDGVKSKAVGKLKSQRRGRTFLCRHCHTTEPTEDGVSSPARLSKGGNKPLMIDGVVCHMKARHGFQILGDEDFFRAPERAAGSVPPVA
ncbi:unnamed protein product [Peniophora sp. CBMAI 1063]|nr:unnamed protein product [Peniophora sp. CBMAI 1063]